VKEWDGENWLAFFVVSNVISSMVAIVWGKKGEDLPKGKEYSTRYLSDKGLKLLIVIKLVGRE